MSHSGKYFLLIIVILIVVTGALGTRREKKDTLIGPRESLFEFQENSTTTPPKKEDPIPYTIEGYYSAFEKRMEYDGEFYGTTTCHTFIGTKQTNQINIEIGNLKPDLRNKILQSRFNNQIQLTLKNNVPDGKGAPPCASFVTILDVK